MGALGHKTHKDHAIASFGFSEGRILASKYEVLTQLGAGWEGEVYLTRECATGIERAVKVFFPQRNPGNRTARQYAKKLYNLRHCEALVQYVTHEIIKVRRQEVTLLVSEFVEGELLSEFQARQPGQRLHYYEALHLLHQLARGLAPIHKARDYHGDLHTGNIIIDRHGISYRVRLIDTFPREYSKYEAIQDDVCDLIRIFYDLVGGSAHYAKQPREVKRIICGLKRTLILGKFRNACQLLQHLENFEWTS